MGAGTDCVRQLMAMGTELICRTRRTWTAGRPRVEPTAVSCALAIVSASTSGAAVPLGRNKLACCAASKRARHEPGDWNCSGIASVTRPPKTMSPALLPAFSKRQKALNKKL